MKVKLLNLNLWQSGSLFDQALTFIEKESPEILLLQEVDNGSSANLPKERRSLGILKQRLKNHPYFAYAPAFFLSQQKVKIESGNAIFSKFPLKPLETIFYDVPYGPFVSKKTAQEDYSFVPRNLQRVVVRFSRGEKLNTWA